MQKDKSILAGIVILIALAIAGFAISLRHTTEHPATDMPPATSTPIVRITETPALPETVRPDKNPQTVATSTQQEQPAPKPEREKPQQVVGTEITVTNVLNAVNQARYDAGLSILKTDGRLAAGAAIKAEDMDTNDYFAHVAPDGTQYTDIIRDQGYSYDYAGENLARRFDTVQELLAGWLASPTHRANIMSAHYTETGIAVYGTYVAQYFGHPKN